MPNDSQPKPLLPVEEARARILEGLAPGEAERCALKDAMGRVLASDVASRLSLPPEAVSAMDGYAARASECQTAGATLTRIGESAAGRPWDGTLGSGQAVRIFTGAVVPDGADCIILQEDVVAESESDGAKITINEAPGKGQFIRPAGLDVAGGDIILTAGTTMSARLIALATSAGHTDISVWTRPHIGVLSTGDELVLPGDVPERGQIISSNATYLAAFIRACGAVPVDLGIARDRAGAMLEQVRAAPVPLDMVVTTGGASVGTHDHLVSDMASAGTELGFWKIAMRPGKPLLHGRVDGIPLLGLPGNPVSSAVCANIFLRPAIARLSGGEHTPLMIAATLGEGLGGGLGGGLGENDKRQDYLRSSLTHDAQGAAIVTPARKQDSSMISVYAHADALIVRPPFDPPKSVGDRVMVMCLDPLM